MAAMARNISKDWSYLYERLFSKLSDEGFHDMWSIGGFLVVFIFCTIVITLTLAVIFSWCCGWCFEQPILGSSKISVLLSPPELSRQKSMQTQAPSLSEQSLSRQKSMQTQAPSLSEQSLSRQRSMQKQTPSLSKQSLSRQRSMQKQTPSLSKQRLSRQKSMQKQTPSLLKQNLSRQIYTSRSVMDPKHPIESVWSPESVPDVQKTEKSSKNKKFKAGSVKVKRKIQPPSRIVRNRDVPV
ncbi:coagulation factor V-like [Oncorhynchus tshawytscha]|uniref:coagulation factor V-like n=1 Tax=Oncorhynchus tshawytscha TaxID=74940 RepID=UPI001C3CFAF8|nr:coagulation factor V-like [Oncorhynchus tshawytscha]